MTEQLKSANGSGYAEDAPPIVPDDTPEATAANGPDEKVVSLAGTTNNQDPRVEQVLNMFSDLKRLEIAPTAQVAARDAMTSGEVSVRKPKDNEFVRASTDPAMCLATKIYTDKDTGEIYYVEPALWPKLLYGASSRLLTLTTNQLGAWFIWPVPLPEEVDGKGRQNKWHASHRDAYHMSKKDWVRMSADRAIGCYRVSIAEGNIREPVWPQKTFGELLAMAFSGMVITDPNHAILRAMRGLVT